MSLSRHEVQHRAKSTFTRFHERSGRASHESLRCNFADLSCLAHFYLECLLKARGVKARLSPLRQSIFFGQQNTCRRTIGFSNHPELVTRAGVVGAQEAKDLPYSSMPLRTKNMDDCGGLQPSELFSPALKVGTDPARSIGSVQGYRS